jgi:hypothetical protein
MHSSPFLALFHFLLDDVEPQQECSDVLAKVSIASFASAVVITDNHAGNHHTEAVDLVGTVVLAA